MNSARISRSILALMALAALVGCGDRKSDHGHNHGHAHDHGHGHDHDAHESEENAVVSFKEGRGLELPAATREAIGIKTAEVEERPFARSFKLAATVFEAGSPARALAMVSPDVADELSQLHAVDAQVLSIRRDVSPTQAEVVLALPGSVAMGATREVVFRGEARPTTTVPTSAVLRSATGTYVYVVNGANFLRTPVSVGSSHDGAVEVLDGLYPGDLVVTTAVEELWLTELRLTKGGGHSH